MTNKNLFIKNPFSRPHDKTTYMYLPYRYYKVSLHNNKYYNKYQEYTRNVFTKKYNWFILNGL
jgi:hypothetical protein